MSVRPHLVALALVASACAGGNTPGADPPHTPVGSTPTSESPPSTGGATTSSTSIPAFDASLIPPVPAATALAGADPVSRSAELIAATADAADRIDAGWLAAYAEFGVPVVALDGTSTIAGDSVGPRWEVVWAIGGLSRGTATISLADAAKVVGWDESTPVDPAVLLDDLRNAVASADRRVQTLGLFVAGKALANGGSDPLDPAVTADQVAMDAATIYLLDWVIAREAAVAIIGPDAAASDAQGIVAGFAPLALPSAASATPCSEALGTADQTSWINWVIGKLGGGVGLEGVVSMPGVVELFVTQATRLTEGVEAGQRAGARAGRIVNRLNIVASVASLIAQVNAVQVNPSMEPDPLIRRRESADGKKAVVSIGLSFNSATLNSNDRALCLLSLVSDALGVGLSFPADGAPLSGVELLVTSGKNFGTKVYFGEGADPRRTADSSGYVLIEVQGKARPTTLPESAREKQDEFGLNLASQVEETTSQSILNVFIDGLSLGSGAPSGIIDIAKTLRYDLGEYLFAFTDFATGYRVDQQWIGGYTLTGEVCDLSMPFVIQADGSAVFAYVGPLTITPLGDGAVSYDLSGTFGGQFPGRGAGGGVIDERADPVTILLDPGSFFATFPAPIGEAPVGDGGHFDGASSDPILRFPDPTTCGGE